MADAVQIRALSESDPGTIQVRIGDPVRFEANAGAEEIARELEKIVAEL